MEKFRPIYLILGSRKLGPKTFLQATLFLFLPLSATFAHDSIDLIAYREASSKFAALVSAAERGNGQKQLETEEVDLLVAVLSDEQRFLKPDQYAANELEGLLDLCGMATRAVMSLGMFSIKEQIDPKAQPHVIAAKIAALMQKNSESFARQLRSLQPFLMRCTAKQVAPMMEFLSSLAPSQLTDVRRQGLQRFRTGLAQLFVGTAQSLANPSYDAFYRLALVRALAESAPTFISALPVAMRHQIRSIVVPMAGLPSPAFSAYLQKIYKALDDETCDGLCSI